MNRILEGRNAVITGASQGLGRVIAEYYIAAGASVLLCARETDSLQEACSALICLASGRQSVEALSTDVSQPLEVDRLICRALEMFPQVHILVNNAGIYGPKGSVEKVDWPEWIRAIEINLFGSVLPCRALLPHMKEKGYGKIIQLSGGGATNPLPNLSAYAVSKAAIVRFTETLAQEVCQYGIDVNAIAPGALNTRLLDEVLEAGPERVGCTFYDKALKQKAQGGTSLETGARLAVFLASHASDGITGKLISAVWDPWENLSERLDDLRKTDVYTLRRIVPRDRGLSWG